MQSRGLGRQRSGRRRSCTMAGKEAPAEEEAWEAWGVTNEVPADRGLGMSELKDPALLHPVLGTLQINN